MEKKKKIITVDIADYRELSSSLLHDYTHVFQRYVESGPTEEELIIIMGVTAQFTNNMMLFFDRFGIIVNNGKNIAEAYIKMLKPWEKNLKEFDNLPFEKCLELIRKDYENTPNISRTYCKKDECNAQGR